MLHNISVVLSDPSNFVSASFSRIWWSSPSHIVMKNGFPGSCWWKNTEYFLPTSTSAFGIRGIGAWTSETGISSWSSRIVDSSILVLWDDGGSILDASGCIVTFFFRIWQKSGLLANQRAVQDASQSEESNLFLIFL